MSGQVRSGQTITLFLTTEANCTMDRLKEETFESFYKSETSSYSYLLMI